MQEQSLCKLSYIATAGANKLLLAMRTNLNGDKANRKDYSIVNQHVWTLTVQFGAGGGEWLSVLHGRGPALGLDLKQGCSLPPDLACQNNVPTSGRLPFICLHGSRTRAGSKLWDSWIVLVFSYCFLEVLKPICYSMTGKSLVHVRKLDVHLLNDGIPGYAGRCQNFLHYSWKYSYHKLENMLFGASEK